MALPCFQQLKRSDIGLPRLFYRASWGLWLLSEGGVHESDVWMGRAYAKDDVDCPTKARGWIVWDGIAWNTSYSLHVMDSWPF